MSHCKEKQSFPDLFQAVSHCQFLTEKNARLLADNENLVSQLRPVEQPLAKAESTKKTPTKGKLLSRFSNTLRKSRCSFPTSLAATPPLRKPSHTPLPYLYPSKSVPSEVLPPGGCKTFRVHEAPSALDTSDSWLHIWHEAYSQDKFTTFQYLVSVTSLSSHNQCWQLSEPP